jgi:RNA polymerase sigma factor (sigma-70 family)
MGMSLALTSAARFDDSGDPAQSSQEATAPNVPTSDRARWLAHHILPHEPILRSWLRGRAIRGLEVDDIVQETYAMMAGLTSVDHIASPRAYAFRTAFSVIQRHLRRGRIARFDTVDDAEWARYVIDEPSPEQQAAAREELRRLSGFVAGLPPKRRLAFTLHKVNGLPYREVALRMGISESAVEKHVASAVLSLMREMS